MENTANTIPAVLRAAAARHPELEAIVDGSGGDAEVRLSYRELDRAVLEVSRALIALGVAPGDRIAIWAQNCWQWCVACLGIAAAGAVTVPINSRFRGREAAQLLDSAEPVLLFTSTGFLGSDYPAMLRAAAPRWSGLRTVILDGAAGGTDLSWRDFLAAGAGVPVEAALDRIAAIRPEDHSDIMYTSGTTGSAKGVVQTHGKNLLAMGSFGAAIGLREGDRNLVLAPLFAQFGLRCGLYIDIMLGATTVLDAVFDPAKIVALIERERITTLPGPPTILAALLSPLARDRDLSSLRTAITGSTIIPEELVIELLAGKVFESVLTAYGLTEACGPVSVSSPDDSPATVSRFAGRVMDHLQVRVVDPDGRTVPAGERGELLVRSAAVMDGYLDDPEQTAATVGADGWLRTGDIGLVTAEGYVRITGRLKDMYICGGFNVYPAEVEATIREHPEVRDVALIGIPDERLGEVGAAYLVLADGATLDPAAMTTWCRDVLANYKVPRRFVALDALPLNSSLKVDKLALRALARS